MSQINYNNGQSWTNVQYEQPASTENAGLFKLQNSLNITEQGSALDASQAPKILDWASNQFIEKNNNYKILWSGASYLFQDQKIPLSEKISDQNMGVILVFSAYESGAAQNYHWSYYFVPKFFVKDNNGQGVNFGTFCVGTNKVWGKYLYINDQCIEGYINNEKNITCGGFTCSNSYIVLRYVIGI